MLRETADPAQIDTRTKNLMRSLAQGSTWTLLKLCNLENFNRSFVGYDQFQICNLHTQLLNLSASVNRASAFYPLTYDAGTFPDAGFTLNESQVRAVNQTLQASGIVAIEGGYKTGKTSLVPLIVHGLLQAEVAIKLEKQRQLQSEVARVYTIEEMLAGAQDSDEDEMMYDNTASSKRQTQALSQQQFPWYQPAYEPVFDMNEGLLEYH